MKKIIVKLVVIFFVELVLFTYMVLERVQFSIPVFSTIVMLTLAFGIISHAIVKKELSAINNADSKQAVAELSKQVSHDLRSPVAALEMMLSVSDEIQGEKREAFEIAIKRVSDISNSLITNLKKP